MAFPIDKKFVVCVTSSALFDMKESDKVYQEQGIDAYKKYQEKNIDNTLDKGVAYPFIKRLLSLNDAFPEERPVEVVLFSKNSPAAGNRAIRSIQTWGLDITRFVFTSGKPNFQYLPAYNSTLFLTSNAKDTEAALQAGYAAGTVLNKTISDDDSDVEFRLAFDFDSVLADDESEQLYKKEGIKTYMEHEVEFAKKPLSNGPLEPLLKRISSFQILEKKIASNAPNYIPILQTAIVTARNKDKVMDIVEAYPEAALAVSLDVCSQDSIKNAVKEAYDKFGTIDVLVNNAGYGYRSAVEEGEIEAVQTLYQTNLFGPIELIKAVLPKMREQKSGYILNVTSIAAARPAVGSGYYASSKAALELLTNGLMKELAPLGIKAMVVQPGAFRTRFYDGESLQGTKAQIGDYEAVVGKSRPGNFENKHQQAGDPDKAGKVIVDVVHNDDLPEILTLGKAAVTAVKSTLEAKIAELDKWAEVSASCDYEEGK